MASSVEVADPGEPLADLGRGAEQWGLHAPIVPHRIRTGETGERELLPDPAVVGRVRAGGAGHGRPAGDERGCGRAVARRQLRDVPDGRGLCTYVNIVLADPESREQLLRDLARFVVARGGRAEVTRSAERGIRLRSCA